MEPHRRDRAECKELQLGCALEQLGVDVNEVTLKMGRRDQGVLDFALA